MIFNNIYKQLMLILIIFLFSCLKQEIVFYEKYETLKKSTWDLTEKTRFEFMITDVNKTYDIYFNMRNNDNYKYSNIFIFSILYYPKGKKEKKISEFVICEPNGKWLGKSNSGIYDNSILFLKNQKFSEKGNYYFVLKHQMYDSLLIGINDIGIKIKEN